MIWGLETHLWRKMANERHFDYTGLITVTSMTENFRTSEAETLWGETFIKISFSGGSYKELNDSIAAALRYNPGLKTVIRGLGPAKFMDEKNSMRSDPGRYPTYLYDDDFFNDVQYIFNRDAVFSRVYPMVRDNDASGFVPGITSFDRYSNWAKDYTYGRSTLFPDGSLMKNPGNRYTLQPKKLSGPDRILNRTLYPWPGATRMSPSVTSFLPTVRSGGRPKWKKAPFTDIWKPPALSSRKY